MLQLIERITHADYPKQRCSLFLARLCKKSWQVKCELLNEAVQKLLTAFFACAVGDFKGAVLTRTLHHDSIVESDLQMRFDNRPLTLRRGRLILVTAKRPSDSVKDRGLALPVLTTDNSKPILCRLKLYGFYFLYVLKFK